MNWADTKSGDEIIVDPGHGFPIQLHKVDRTTRTQIIIGHWHFRRTDGYRVGDSPMYRAYLLEPTPELRARIERVAAARYILGHSYEQLERLPLDMLNSVVAGLKRLL